MEDGRLQAAAYVAGTFHLDPIEVLQADYFDWIIRISAANYYNRKVEEEQQKGQ